jgi:hypothetical protein
VNIQTDYHSDFLHEAHSMNKNDDLGYEHREKKQQSKAEYNQPQHLVLNSA